MRSLDPSGNVERFCVTIPQRLAHEIEMLRLHYKAKNRSEALRCLIEDAASRRRLGLLERQGTR